MSDNELEALGNLLEKFVRRETMTDRERDTAIKVLVIVDVMQGERSKVKR